MQKSFSWGYIHHITTLSDTYLNKIIPQMKVISCTGYTISGNGLITDRSGALGRKAYAITRSNRTAYYPLISFSSVREGRRVLASQQLRSRSAKSIQGLVRRHSLSGIHLDFEYFPAADIVHLQSLLRELRKHLSDTKITMAVFPPVDFPKRWNAFHDLKKLSPYLDEIVIMCYDYHRPDTNAGPVTDIQWAEKNITEALKYFQPGEIWLGIPAYGYRWTPGKKGTAVSARFGSALSRKYGGKRHRSGTVYVSYSRGGTHYQVYFSDSKTRTMLCNLAEKYALAGTALWRLGFEEQ